MNNRAGDDSDIPSDDVPSGGSKMTKIIIIVVVILVLVGLGLGMFFFFFSGSSGSGEKYTVYDEAGKKGGSISWDKHVAYYIKNRASGAVGSICTFGDAGMSVSVTLSALAGSKHFGVTQAWTKTAPVIADGVIKFTNTHADDFSIIYTSPPTTAVYTFDNSAADVLFKAKVTDKEWKEAGKSHSLTFYAFTDPTGAYDIGFDGVLPVNSVPDKLIVDESAQLSGGAIQLNHVVGLISGSQHPPFVGAGAADAKKPEYLLIDSPATNLAGVADKKLAPGEHILGFVESKLTDGESLSLADFTITKGGVKYFVSPLDGKGDGHYVFSYASSDLTVADDFGEISKGYFRYDGAPTLAYTTKSKVVEGKTSIWVSAKSPLYHSPMDVLDIKFKVATAGELSESGSKSSAVAIGGPLA